MRPEKANANVRAPGVPPSVTVTDGVPVEASTVAVAPTMSASAPFAPSAPSAPAGPRSASSCSAVKSEYENASPGSPLSPFGPARSAELVPLALVTVSTVPSHEWVQLVPGSLITRASACW